MTRETIVDRRTYTDRRMNPERRQNTRLDRWEFDRRVVEDRRKTPSEDLSANQQALQQEANWEKD